MTIKSMIFRILVSICGIGVVLNNALVVVGFFTRQDVSYSLQMTIVFITISCIYIYRSTDIQWFGKLLDSGHDANLVISKIAAIICILPAVLFSLNPWIQYFGRRFGF